MEFRIASGNGGTGTCRRGADEHGCEFAPVASQSHIPSKFLVPLAALMLHSDSLNSTDITLLSPPNAFPGKLHSFLKIFPDKMCYTLDTNANHKEISMKQRFIALICIATLVFCGCGGKKQSSVQTDSGSEQPDATEESTEQSRNDPVTITFNSKTETYHADDLSTVLLYTSYQKPMVTIDGHPKISKTITQSLNEELAKTVEPLEQVIDELNKAIKKRHIKRLRKGKCSIELGLVLADIVTNYERVSDHCSNIAVCLIQEQDKEVEEHDLTAHMDEEDNRKFAEQIKEYTEKYALPEK